MFDEIKLYSFNSIFEVFLPIGFGLYAAKGAFAWVVHFYEHYTEVKADLSKLGEEVEEKITSGKEDGNVEKHILAYLYDLGASVKFFKIVKYDNGEKNLTWASRLDFLQLGLFTLVMLILTGFEKLFEYPPHNPKLVSFVFGLNVISLGLYAYRQWCFKLDGDNENKYPLIRYGISHFPIAAWKGVASCFCIILYCYLTCVYLSPASFAINISIIIFMSIGNLLIPFITLYLRVKEFNAYCKSMESEARVFVADIKGRLKL